MPTHFVSSSFLNTLLKYIKDNGYDEAALVAKIEQLSARYQWRMPRNDFLTLLANIQRRHNKPALGFCIGRSLQPEDYGMVGYIAVTCSSLGQALQRYQKHLSLVDSSLQTSLEDRQGSRVTRWWHNEASAKGIWGEFGLMVFINFYQALIGRDLPPDFVELPGEPDGDPKVYELLAGCPVKFGCNAVGIALPKTFYAMKISTSDPYLRGLYDRQAAALLSNLTEENDFLKEVKSALKFCLEENQSSAEQVAKHLGLSLRTFYRRLDEQGFRYRSLLADIRFALAKGYLQDETLSLAEIALLLGYSDQSAFTRAFVGWAGATPTEYR
ncbi:MULTISPECIES: AraC family transcriptional regulator [Alteromonas]|jgi:AraC-like DNA-binding protein|uniref:AraC family transcriptional regulator n=1 Tax=Alteromonas TaxID=226 RepID=UPI001EF202BA|nr:MULTISPECIES: AraC family transcriptional regulator [Alteromonas]MCG7639781.1 AraC family transcriptional regulator [Alteromonas sp. CNT1-28]MCG7813958.1 AraC family transcriptional regulator [Alteromonas sp. MCA-1]MCZ4242345.1 AraC family transcriptional regulator [Alteromonas macleodii]